MTTDDIQDSKLEAEEHMTKTYGMARQHPSDTKHVDLAGVKPEEEQSKQDMPMKRESNRLAAVGN